MIVLVGYSLPAPHRPVHPSREKYDEAEPLLVQGYQALKERRKQIPPAEAARPAEALDRVVRLYDAWAKKSEAERWRGEQAGSGSR